MTAATIAALATATFASATGAHATPAAGICKPLSVAGAKVQWSVIGNVSCTKAKPWLLKILGKHGAPNATVKPTNGPRGFHCSATDNTKGVPTIGDCYTGTLKFPNNAFQWFG